MSNKKKRKKLKTKDVAELMIGIGTIITAIANVIAVLK